MPSDLEISLLGELRVRQHGAEMPLPASRKARALLAFLVATGRPHRRERLCEVFWDLPDDPKAALRWALTKLRKVVDTPGQPRILADRERVCFDPAGAQTDLTALHARLRDASAPPGPEELEHMARALGQVLLDGLDGAGGEAFEAWLVSEREDARMAHAEVLRRLATHPATPPMQARKWTRLWQQADPDAPLPEDPACPGGDGRTGLAPAPARPPLAPAADDPGPAPARRRAVALRAQRIGFCRVRDGTQIAYATLGEGPPLLKAANWLTHLEFDWNSPIWGRSFAEIARSRTFIRYDERGCGLSDWEVEDLGFDAFVEDLEAVADRLGLERFPLLGISQGCAVSIEYAVRHPERVSGLILIGGYAAGWRHLATPEEQARREAVLTLTELGWGTDNPAYRHIFSRTFMPGAREADLEWFDAFQRQTTSPRNAARFQDAFGHIDVRDRLASVRAPTLVLHSRDDQRIPVQMGRDIAATIPGARFVELDSPNHVLVEHEPAWSVCVAAIDRFLDEAGI
ncbi:alpha/beta hydrolase [Oceanicella sp. SM1341]|uniref:alpha/beta hydrolase n=1 Tax=Oceanicella sp. SM1341 TaxID=1548889 RepID=UPI001E5066B7|nr:alpha/beta hydrolase [Oceanicella sp. SM1341]